MGLTPAPIPRWKLQPLMLEDLIFRTALSNAIENYFWVHTNSTGSRQTEWDAFKAVIRGVAIGTRTGVRNNLIDRLKDVEASLAVLEGEAAGTNDQLTQLQKANIQYAELLEELRVVDHQLYIQKQHAHSDRAGPLLARLIRNTPPLTPIMEIQNAAGNTVRTQIDINNAFRDYYTKLYSPPCAIPDDDMTALFTDIPLPQLKRDQAASLAQPITEIEIRQAIKALPRNNSPGADGLPVEFYATYIDLLAPHLHSLYTEALEIGVLPHSTLQALVVSLLKPGRDPLHISNYRPLSLLNTDYKILSKLLAIRLNQFIPSLVHSDQCGFVPGRSTALNIRRLHQILLNVTDPGILEGCISLDLRQAFDSLRWDYMFSALRRCHIPDTYIAWVKLLYTNPTARARTGRHISEPYAVARGMRQGCPLSPLLFILAMEPLLHKLRAHTGEKGILRGRVTHMVSAYADDLILYFRDMTADFTPIPSIFETLQHHSGLTINDTKSYAFFFDSTKTNENVRFGPWIFQSAPVTFNYLGINIYRRAEDLIDGNIGRTLIALKTQIQFWNSLPLSIAGRVTITKMVLLPRLLLFFLSTYRSLSPHIFLNH